MRVTYGTEKGYLFEKTKLETKLRERIPLLKDKNITINIVQRNKSDAIRILMLNHKTTKVDEEIFLDEISRAVEKAIFLSKKIFAKMMEMDENIIEIGLKRKVADNTYEEAWYEDTVMDENNLYYFISTTDQVNHEYIVEI